MSPAELKNIPEPRIALIGCCGAYCGTCPVLAEGTCKGCKLGYDDNTRDIRAARCAMKRCCLVEKNLDTCADCPEYKKCSIIQGFFAKKGYKYRKYQESLYYIQQHGYHAFLEAARSWKRAYGRLEPPCVDRGPATDLQGAVSRN